MRARPDAYGESGLATFIGNQNGRIFEKNLGKSTAIVAEKMTMFDPGAGWKETSP